MREMLEAGVHFGHQTRFWNPKMAPYIFGHRNKIHIVNLEKTLAMYNEAMNYIRQLAANRGTILMVGTKRQARDIIAAEAQRAGMPYVDQRWLGGTLTNFNTIRGRIAYLKSLYEMEENGTFEQLPKKEVIKLLAERDKLEKNLGGIKNMTKLPDAIFVVDPRKEHIAVAEAHKLGIPIVGIVDTNCDPDEVDYIIPGNDDAIRAVKLILSAMSSAVLEGRQGESMDQDVVEAEVAEEVAEADSEAEEETAEEPAEEE